MRPSIPLLRSVTFNSTAGPPSTLLKERVRRTALLDKLAQPQDLVGLFRHDDWLGWSGFTGIIANS